MGNPAALALYRELLRKTRALPSSSQSYYRNALRSAFVNFDSEQDPQRLQEIMERGRQDADWILKKVRRSACLAGAQPTVLPCRCKYQ